MTSPIEREPFDGDMYKLPKRGEGNQDKKPNLILDEVAAELDVSIAQVTRLVTKGKLHAPISCNIPSNNGDGRTNRQSQWKQEWVDKAKGKKKSPAELAAMANLAFK